MKSRVKAEYELNKKGVNLKNLTTKTDENFNQYNIGLGTMMYLGNTHSIFMYRGMDFYKIAKLGCLDGGSFGVMEYEDEKVPAKQVITQAFEEGFGEALMVYKSKSKGLELLIPEFKGEFEEYNEVISNIIFKEYDKIMAKTDFEHAPKVNGERKVKASIFGHPEMYSLSVDGEKLAENILYTSEPSNKTLELMFPVMITSNVKLVPGKNLSFYDGEGYNRAFVIQDNKTGLFDIQSKKYGFNELENKFIEFDMPGQTVYSELSAKEVNTLFETNKKYFIQANASKEWIGKVNGLTEVLNEKGKMRMEFDNIYRNFPINSEIKTESKELLEFLSLNR
ncbi:MAG: hypothetical protein WC376_02110 [Candidatus Nanoarchaeia archaeon]|jgi:hypothetical protein